ncbi:TPA: ash family protein [Klebsiella pneumoniae]|nr:ash family protein [Klebsiella pneumoniae]
MCHSDQASAKSGAGIGLPDYYKGAHTARAVFLCVKHSYTQIMVGCVGGGEIRAGSFVAGKTNSAQFTTT